MGSGVAGEEDYVAVRDFPAGSIVKLTAAMAVGASLGFFVFHLLAWALGLPSPFLWFGSETRWSDIVSVNLAVPVSVFLISLCGLAVLKGMAMLELFNFRLRVR